MAGTPRIIVLTGGSGGIGSVIAGHFLKCGDHVVNLDREPFPEDRKSADGRLTTIPTDLAQVGSVVAAFAEVDRVAGAPPDCLVCCAAMSRSAHVLDVHSADLDLMLAVNVRGTYLCCQEAGRRMRVHGKGHIVIITSVAAAQAWAGESVYCLTKAAQASMAQSFAVELAPFGIAVNAVAPGIIDVKSKGMAGTRSGDVYRHEMERFPSGRFGAPEEIAAAVTYLTSASWITGQTLTVDGGFMATGLAYLGEARERLLKGGST